jgi:hypothetical protein
LGSHRGRTGAVGGTIRRKSVDENMARSKKCRLNAGRGDQIHVSQFEMIHRIKLFFSEPVGTAQNWTFYTDDLI